MHRFFIDQQFENNIINPSKEILHQLIKVLRIKKNEDFIVIQNKKEYLCNLINNQIILKKKLIKQNYQKENELILVQGVPKSNKLSFILQKSTEIGVKKIYLWKTDYSNILFADILKKDQRFKKILKEAAEQSNRIDFPDISYIDKLEQIEFKDDDLLFVFYEKADPIKENFKKYFFKLSNSNKFKRIIIFIGPEGGWSEKEINLLKLKDAKLVSMGENILRTETAAIVALALVKYLI
ncbi:MAG: ribosomal RNA small subunit methyltransferase E [Candidatus Hepatoplasma scabrum]|nr:MAG: ribosomal RNA small subunit methyltransferase E [Candidatus Hepatoplasma sp.]